MWFINVNCRMLFNISEVVAGRRGVSLPYVAHLFEVADMGLKKCSLFEAIASPMLSSMCYFVSFHTSPFRL